MINMPEEQRLAEWAPEEFPVGCVTQAGWSAKYLTGGWRSMRPVWDEEACKHCLLCWIACPDSSIITAEGKMTGIDYDHCKGCGVCVHECKFGALEFVRENQKEA